MDFWRRLFSSRRKEQSDPARVERTYRMLKRFVAEGEPPIDHLPQDAQIEIQSGSDVDELPNVIGLFGHTPTNPIPVRGPMGQVSYLSRLMDPSGRTMFGHRIGHIDRIDIYEVVSLTGAEWDVLYLSMYHPRNSRKFPSGYGFAETSRLGPIFTCVNSRVENFPYTMDVAIKGYMRTKIGYPLCPDKLGQYLESKDFTRPPEQLERLKEADRLGMEPSPIYYQNSTDGVHPEHSVFSEIYRGL